MKDKKDTIQVIFFLKLNYLIKHSAAQNCAMNFALEVFDAIIIIMYFCNDLSPSLYSNNPFQNFVVCR